MPPEPPTFRILCEEVYARAARPELLADPDYEWRIFPDLGGDYPIVYVFCDGAYLPLPATSEEHEILGGIDLDLLHEKAAMLRCIRRSCRRRLGRPSPIGSRFRLVPAISRHRPERLHGQPLALRRGGGRRPHPGLALRFQ